MEFYLPTGQHVSQSIDLELALWDGPPDRRPSDDGTEEETALPLSLRRPIGFGKMPLNVFANFSTLFGIGQHITLTPLHVTLGDDLWAYLSASLQRRHHRKVTAVPSLTCVLSGWLQTGLNLATASSSCHLPAFGLWGPYQPQKQVFANFLEGAASILPTWLQASQQLELTELPYHRRRKKANHLNRAYVPPVLTGQCLTAAADQPVVFWTALLPNVSARGLGGDSRLTVWGNVLLRHVPDESVALWGARHVYRWTRPTATPSFFAKEDHGWDDKLWRQRSTADVSDDNEDTMEVYRRDCRRIALQRMEKAAGVTDKEPLWGPVEDPLASIHATITWNASVVENELQPLLTLPLKIRSRHNMSQEDWVEAEEAIENSILNPYRPGVFVVQVQGDSESAQATLTATQRCILAALIRTATLPGETMLSHLLDEQIIDGWDTKVGNELAHQLADRVQAQPGTRALVDAMDWEEAADATIESAEAQEIVHRVLDGDMSLDFPEVPEGKEQGDISDELWKPLQKSAPFGRLVSSLFMEMASVRSPSSMVLVFSTFCQEIRRRWDRQESLPNMHFVSGLDPSHESYSPKRCFSNVGDKASFAAQVDSSEPDPDDWNCLVGQKLQVFNLCVETAIAEELRMVELLEKRPRSENQTFTSPTKLDWRPNQRPRLGKSPSKDQGVAADDEFQSPHSDNTGLVENVSPREEAPRSGEAFALYLEETIVEILTPVGIKSKSLMNGDMMDGLPQIGGDYLRGDDSSRGSRSHTATEEASKTVTSQSSYYDAEEGGALPSVLQMIMGKDAKEPSAAANVLQMMLGTDRNAERKGARCPVQGASLTNGEQVYAPYLRRPFPLTDDIIIQRRLMLAQQRTLSKAEESSTAVEQLEIAHRFQFDKLSADMSAFKAANPWAAFDDFTAWYGTPVNPLEEYEEARSQDIRMGFSSDDTVQSAIARGAESFAVIELTKEFWAETWEMAQPLTASENSPLFDPTVTAEMALYYLETLHPATLLCNVLAANLSAAYFGLVFAAEEALEISSVRASLKRLRRRIELALNLLSLDAVTSGTQKGQNPLHPGLSSVEAMAASEAACIVLGENEVLLARARSLLSKFPGKFTLVDRILNASESSVIPVDTEAEQRDVLRTVLTSKSSRPTPTLREYLLRNTDQANPCQLCVRYGNHVKDLESEGGLLLAMTKTQPAM
jgi:Rab3 GTPase-activating protein catalytic subunit